MLAGTSQQRNTVKWRFSAKSLTKDALFEKTPQNMRLSKWAPSQRTPNDGWSVVASGKLNGQVAEPNVPIRSGHPSESFEGSVPHRASVFGVRRAFIRDLVCDRNGCVAFQQQRNTSMKRNTTDKGTRPSSLCFGLLLRRSFASQIL